MRCQEEEKFICWHLVSSSCHPDYMWCLFPLMPSHLPVVLVDFDFLVWMSEEVTLSFPVFSQAFTLFTDVTVVSCKWTFEFRRENAVLCLEWKKTPNETQDTQLSDRTFLLVREVTNDSPVFLLPVCSQLLLNKLFCSFHAIRSRISGRLLLLHVLQCQSLFCHSRRTKHLWLSFSL